MLAYHNDPALKAATVAEVQSHMDADALVQGYGYWKDGKGCAVGCLLKSGNHIEYEARFGIPIALAHLEDRIFENLPVEAARKWPMRFMLAPKPGADLSLIVWKFLAFVVEDALSHDAAASVREQCQPALDVVRARARGEIVSENAAAYAAADAAKAAAYAAAWAAADAAYAAYAAADAAKAVADAADAAYAAADAAKAVADAADAAYAVAVTVTAVAADAARAADAAKAVADAARAAAWERYADKLIELMEAA